MAIAIRGVLGPALVAWLVLAGVILGRFADDAMPTYYLARPMIAAALIAAVAGLLAKWTLGPQAPLGAGVSAALIVSWAAWADVWYVAVAALVACGLAVAVARLRARALPSIPRVVSTAGAAFVLGFSLLGLARAIAVAEPEAEPVAAERQSAGESLYLILLDGYPRADTLSHGLGIDNQPFLSALSDRGFDVYDQAKSDRRLTDLTLLALLTGTTDGVPTDAEFRRSDRRVLRQALAEASLPREAQRIGYEFIVIDSPVGHVTFSGGTHVQPGGLNTFEERLLGESLLAPLVAAYWPMLPTESLRSHLKRSLDEVADSARPGAGRLVLAHLLVPHPPFLWDEAGNALPVPAFWPRLQLFESVIENTGDSISAYSAGMRGQLTVLNAQLLAAIDAIVDRDPTAAIVLFSDHGGRFTLAEVQAEWYRSFLAARTPGHAGLFGGNPSPTVILRDLLAVYAATSP